MKANVPQPKLGCPPLSIAGNSDGTAANIDRAELSYERGLLPNGYKGRRRASTDSTGRDGCYRRDINTI